MSLNRRTLLKGVPALAAFAPAFQARALPLRKIATEEAFTIPEMIEPMRDVLRQGGSSLDLVLLRTVYAEAARPPASVRDYRMEGAVWGYGVETSTHVVRLIFSGALDRFPKLRLVLGHMGEAVPFWMWRLDFMGAPGARGAARKNELKPSEYFQRNVAITTSGVEDPLVLRFCVDKLGIDRVMWAVDYPVQPMGPAVKFLQSSPLSDAERAQLAHANAERIFGLK